MQSDPAVTRLRSARDKRSVLKIKFLSMRGRYPNSPIFMFEGDDDKIVYGRWVNRLRPDLAYEVFVCKGKAGVAMMQAMLHDDAGDLRANAYFFIDRDFDDARRFRDDSHLFMTEMYAVENYLVCEEVVGSILRDEFPCHDYPEIREAINEIFTTDYNGFLQITREVNRRLYAARQEKIDFGKSMPDSIGAYAKVLIGDVRASDISPVDIIPIEDFMEAEKISQHDSSFEGLSPRERYRGKNALLFLEKWLEQLCLHFSLKTGLFYGSNITGRVRQHELSLGAFASKSPLPCHLQSFLQSIPV